ncbi:MAG: carboxypeptidase-like regulatory domain-containing protein [Cyclobacteriaceae bacterium]|nr:carboxypeptidase-like regulatory domain-containing protein [Cyclobacteriaceae bacterium]
MRSFLLFSLAVSCFSGSGQTFSGIVVDRVTKESLPYANIRIVGRGIGAVSSRSGEFSIDLAGVSNKDTIRFTYIGYRSFAVVTSDLKLLNNNKVELAPESVELAPMVVTAKSTTKVMGINRVGRRMTGWGDYKSFKGRIRGLLIEGAECPVKVSSFSFRINHNDWDSVAFRLNFLRVKDGIPAESILSKNIFFTTSLRHKWVKVDLKSYDVVICEKVIVTLEWVDAWGKTGEFSNLLTYSLGKVGGYSFSQEAGDEKGEFKYEDNAPAMFIEVFSN